MDTPSHELSQSTCANCGASLHGPYCAECGQEHLEREPTFRQVFADAWDEVVKIDGRVLATLSLLFRKPGQLTLEFFGGRRIRFVTPVKLYLTCSGVYFVVTNFADIRARINSGGAIHTSSTSAATDKLLKSIVQQGTGIFFGHLSTIYIFMVPLTALATALLFRGRRKGLMFHMVFVLYCWSGLFLAQAILSLAHFPANFIQVLLLVSVPYMIFALRRAFDASWLEASIKSALFSVSAALLSITVLIGIMVSIAIQRRTELDPTLVLPGRHTTTTRTP